MSDAHGLYERLGYLRAIDGRFVDIESFDFTFDRRAIGFGATYVSTPHLSTGSPAKNRTQLGNIPTRSGPIAANRRMPAPERYGSTPSKLVSVMRVNRSFRATPSNSNKTSIWATMLNNPGSFSRNAKRVELDRIVYRTQIY